MSRNAPFRFNIARWLCCLSGLVTPLVASAQTHGLTLPLVRESTNPPARVVILHDSDATEAFQPRLDKILPMVQRGLTALTGKLTVPGAWRSLLSTQDIVGIKVYSAPGPNSGTRVAVAAAVVESLLQAKFPATNIVVWDKQLDDLRRAGFFDLAARYGVRVEAAAAAGYDEGTFYSPDEPVLGHLIYGDLEFGRTGAGVGRKSFVSKLVTKGMTKIINLSPLLNHYRAGVSGNLYSLTMGAVDNTLRFESDPKQLAKAVPELYALASLGDKVVVSIVDALICQYEGERSTRLQDAVTLNELRFSTDPVALDVLSLQELNVQRPPGQGSPATNRVELFSIASELWLGVSDPSNIRVERIK